MGQSEYGKEKRCLIVDVKGQKDGKGILLLVEFKGTPTTKETGSNPPEL